MLLSPWGQVVAFTKVKENVLQYLVFVTEIASRIAVLDYQLLT